MDLIFHEKQEGQLCAKHCLNAILQGPYFTEFDLASIAESIDEEEKITMAEGGENREEYRQFISKPSRNMDDSGYFSIQVIINALRVWNLDLIPFNSQNMIAEVARNDPTTQRCYICNYNEHWFAIRKIGQQWFNLNSLLTGPELISDTYLSLFLTQLQKEGYSIFIVNGELPPSKPDQVFQTMKVEQHEKLKPLNEKKTLDSCKEDSFTTEEEKNFIQLAIQASLESNADDEKKQLQAAIALSLETLE